MVLFKYLLLLGGTGMIAAAVALLTRDLYLISKHRQLTAMDPQTALSEVAKALKLPAPTFAGNSAPEIYSAEREVLRSRRIIPLIHLRRAIMLGPNVRQATLSPEGSLNLNNAWLEAAKP